MKNLSNLKKAFFGEAGIVRTLAIFSLIAGGVSYGLISNTFSTGTFASNSPLGVFERITPDGKAEGWALDPDAIKDPINIVVTVYLSGSNVVSYNTTTNVTRNDINTTFSTTGTHGFSWEIPSQLKDGKPHKLYIYAQDKRGGNRTVLLTNPSGVSTFNFLNNAYVFPQEKKSLVSPIRLFSFNDLNDAITNQPLSLAKYRSMFNAISLSRNKTFSFDMESKRENGFTPNVDGTYVAIDGLVGPLDLESTSAQGKYCTATQRRFKAYSYHPTNDRGDFCRIHDSILASKKVRFPSGDSYFSGKSFDDFKFDHDRDEWLDENRKNPNPTPRIFATEDWFLHKNKDGIQTYKDGTSIEFKSGYRIITNMKQKDLGGTKYRYNPAIKEMQEYIAGFYLRELKGGRTPSGEVYAPVGSKGIYMDMIFNTWDSSRWGSFSDVKEYTGKEQYAYGNAVYDQVCYATKALRKFNFTFHGSNLWEFSSRGQDPARPTDIADCMDGIHSEYFAQIPWHNRFQTPENFELQLRKYDQYLKMGKDLMLTNGSQKLFGTDDYTKEIRYLLSAYLLLADGEKTTFFSSTRLGYWGHFYETPEYTARLGVPIEDRRIVGAATDYKYQRKFECGVVTVDAKKNEGDIKVTPNCNPGYTAKPGTTPASTGGTVVDESTNQPIPGIKVTMVVTPLVAKQYKVTATTDEKGNYRFTNQHMVGDQYTLLIDEKPTGYKERLTTSSNIFAWNHCLAPIQGWNPDATTRFISGETRSNSGGYHCQKSRVFDCGGPDAKGVSFRCNFKLSKIQ